MEAQIVEQQRQDQANADSPPFRLFDLPAELRIRVYEETLSPTGVLCLSQTAAKRFAVSPSIPAMGLLSTCRQVYREARDILYSENEVCFFVDAHDTSWPLIKESRLPQRVLERLQHICVILDCTANFWYTYEDVDFTGFEALVSLLTMRVGALFRSNRDLNQMSPPERLAMTSRVTLAAQLLTRVPAKTKLITDFESGSPQQTQLNEALTTCRSRIGLSDVENTQQMPPDEVKDFLALVPIEVRGSKSGGNSDVFGRYYTEAGLTSRRFGLYLGELEI